MNLSIECPFLMEKLKFLISFRQIRFCKSVALALYILDVIDATVVKAKLFPLHHFACDVWKPFGLRSLWSLSAVLSSLSNSFSLKLSLILFTLSKETFKLFCLYLNAAWRHFTHISQKIHFAYVCNFTFVMLQSFPNDASLNIRFLWELSIFPFRLFNAT